MVVSGFWKNLKAPVVGLAPMDGVTDAAFRHIVCKLSSPSVVYTEFTNVEGLARGATEMLKAFIYEEGERPVVGQLFGVEVESFYKGAIMLCAMGFDGVDVNMGCPVNKIARKGSGAALIQTPELAKEIVLACKKGCKDWAEGVTMEEAGVHEDIIAAVENLSIKVERKQIPVSVKTRIGFDKDVSKEWILRLLEVEPAAICLHGRTLRQLYRGEADWKAISGVTEMCKSAGVKLLGNGDVKSMDDAMEKIKKYNVDGVLVGRALMGNPWFFGEKEPSVKDRLKVLVEHAEYFENLGHMNFHNIRKHLAWYCKGFDGAKEIRMKLMKVDSTDEIQNILGLK